MTRAYSNPDRAGDPHALPDIEVFWFEGEADIWNDGEERPAEAGWYWWSCFPGCLPNGDSVGPFATEAEALADAQDCNG